MKLTLETFEPGTSALDFVPEILAIQKRPPSPLPRFLLYTVLALFGILLCWSVFAKLDIVASAQGKLVPRTYVKIVQPADSGVVKEILVRDGDRVKAGQVLMRMDTTVSEADLAIVTKEAELRQLQLRRIEAEMLGKRMERVGGVSPSLVAEVEAQAAARYRAYQDALRVEEAARDQARGDLEAAEAQVVKLEQLLPIYREEESSLARLAEQGLVPKFQYSEKQRTRIETEQNLTSQRRTVTSQRARIGQSSNRLAQITSDYRQQLSSERVEAQAALDRAKQELAKQEHRGRLSELRAPQDGVIKDVATYTEGAVVNAGTVLMSLVPIDDELVAEVMIRNDDVGFVRAGQSVKIKLATYQFQKYGMIDGTVERISADSSEMTGQNKTRDEESDENQQAMLSPYKAIVRLHSQELNSRGNVLPITAGMRVVAELKEGERTVMEYLLSPVRKLANEAARER
jgi:HlyD family secretion protein